MPQLSSPATSFTALLLVAISSASCGAVTEIENVHNPSRSHYAVVYEVDVGATAGVASHVQILPADRRFKRSNDGLVFSAHMHGPPQVSWESDDILLIRYGNGRIAREENQYKQFSIKYVFGRKFDEDQRIDRETP